MKIENLEIGKKYKWKELCNTLEIKVSEGNTRKKDLKKLESYCKFTKEKAWFTIEQIYDTPKEIIDKRKGREVVNSIDSLMASAIMYKVVNTENGYYCGSINSWLFEIGIVNTEFIETKQKVYKSFTELTEGFTPMDKDFITLEYSSLRSHLINALEKIRKTKLADYFIGCKIGYTKEGKIQWTRELTEDEMKLLYKKKNELYDKYEIINELDLVFGNKTCSIERDMNIYKKFSEELERFLIKEWGANFEYIAYKVILKNTNKKALDLIDEKFFKGYTLSFLKSSIYEKRKKSAEKRQSDVQEKYNIINKEGEFFDNTNKLIIQLKHLTEVEINKINGIYVELWDAIYKNLMN